MVEAIKLFNGMYRVSLDGVTVDHATTCAECNSIVLEAANIEKACGSREMRENTVISCAAIISSIEVLGDKLLELYDQASDLEDASIETTDISKEKCGCVMASCASIISDVDMLENKLFDLKENLEDQVFEGE